MKINGEQRIVVIGDIHGEFEGLQEVLLQAGLIDSKRNWTGGGDMLVQTGDVIDRGRRSRACTELLRTLQIEAEKAGGAVVRLCGNHELLVMQREFWFINIVRDDIKDPMAFRELLIRDVMEGRLLAAYTDGQRLFSHAGLRSFIRQKLIEEMDVGSKVNDDPRGLTQLVDYINRLFREAVVADDIQGHPLFWVSPSRGGADAVGGIFWNDWYDNGESEEADSIAQVFGHTPSHDGRLRATPCLKLIDVDGGMTAVYGGNRMYLEILHDGKLWQNRRVRGGWKSDMLRRGDSCAAEVT